MLLKDYQNEFPKIITSLSQARKKNRVGHAWIFSGDCKDTLKNFALAWLQTCVCRHTSSEGFACGECETCFNIVKKKYANWFELQPSSKSRRILVDEVRDLERFLHLGSGGELKVGIIVEADRMLDQAQNAFLKTLEEPPRDSILLLVTTNPAALLPTIRSRCQTINLFRNQSKFNFDGNDQLYASLASMGKGKGSLTAINSAATIIAILDNLEKKAKDSGAKELKTLTTGPFAENKNLISKFEASIEANIRSAYLGCREQVINAIFTWYAQQYIRSMTKGGSLEFVANKEIYKSISPDVISDIPKSSNALHNLELVDGLFEVLNYNVEEKLAIQDFCFKICSKS